MLTSIKKEFIPDDLFLNPQEDKEGVF